MRPPEGQVAMAKLIYASNMSLDGYTEDATGAFDWAEPRRTGIRGRTRR